MNPWLFWGPYLFGYGVSLGVLARWISAITPHGNPDSYRYVAKTRRENFDEDVHDSAFIAIVALIAIVWPAMAVYGISWLAIMSTTVPSRISEARETRREERLTRRKNALEKAERELKDVNDKLERMGIDV